jgi:RNA polymerase sigma factor (sigma-70 family)
MLYCLGLTKDQSMAENLATDAFVKLFEQPKKPPIENPRAWLYTVCKRDISTWWMTNNRRKEILHQVKDRFQTVASSLADEYFDLQRIDKIKERELSEDELSVWGMHEDGYDNREIAEKTGMAEKTVANKKSTARNKLKKALA